MQRDLEKSQQWLTLARKWDLGHRHPENYSIMSYHVFTHECSDSKSDTLRVPIEPLVGFLRHPLAVCVTNEWATILSTEYILPMRESEVMPAPLPPYASRYLFDLGASLWSANTQGGSSLKWLVQGYKRRGLLFDRIFAWEATPHTTSEIFYGLPAQALDAISYFNVPVDPTPGAKHNPLRTLLAVASENDFVVLKIDIDVNPVEEALMEQVLGSKALLAAIDEIYFEHHVRPSPMWHKGWHKTTKPTNKSLADSYQLFTTLRQAGIRAHAW
eukprot:CAMPEP_0119303802 /NCGR_PEP_ID=MMETSP1333-20130426/5183_1 /TAXON_ID=418940 /ORGANISM="Scyphosphaera apsteinii, Strain RCC1455" /LENGTH=271 /DNA_ID=CAMNT_0007306569 /DNA_START=1 /DNA_END=813 /DNA_ORIENTATION=+